MYTMLQAINYCDDQSDKNMLDHTFADCWRTVCKSYLISHALSI